MKPLSLVAVLLAGLSSAWAEGPRQFNSPTLDGLGAGTSAPGAPAVTAAPTNCGGEANFTPGPGATPRPPGPQCVDWGQSKADILNSVFQRDVEASAKDDGFFKKLFSTKPKVETVAQYLPSDSPAVADNRADEDPHVSVGGAAFDATQSQDEMAGLIGHELWHTRRKQWEKACWNRGFHEARKTRPSLPGSTFMAGKDCAECLKVKPFQRDLEREADCHGAKIAAEAGFDPRGLEAALKHVKDLGEALGADPSQDEEHDSFEQRDKDLKSCIHNWMERKPLFDAVCPWGDSD